MESIIDLRIHTKAKNILKYLLNGEGGLILQSHRNNKLLKKLGISSVNNTFYNPIQGA